MLTRIYGTAFHSKDDLEAYLQRLEDARARDHRKLGRELGLFTFSEVSPGSVFWLPRGTAIFNALVELNRRMQTERGYVEVQTPLLYESTVWETSGHWGKYKDNIFVAPYEEREFGLKPMNCPGHAHMFSLQRWSYRDLPYRCAEPGHLHRREPSGTLHGLLRVRHFVQDDAHIFCTEDQIEDEVARCLNFGYEVYRMFDFPVHAELSTRPDNRLGSDEFWDRAEGMLASALEREGVDYRIAEGEGAFYAPKIDLHMTDSLGRSWQMGTVQLDSQQPERLGCRYAGADNQEHVPYVIHRALLGSFERFTGILVEHYAGAFPFWLAPAQIRILPVAADHVAAARELAQRLGEYRVEVDASDETLGKRIRNAEVEKIPHVIVYGDKESEKSLAVRRRGGEQSTLSLEELRKELATL
jgi:threonyl-tRNA synthetase